MLIKEIRTPQEKVELTAICDKVVQGVSTNGQPYLTIVLKDQTGNIEMRLWNASAEDMANWKKGNVYDVVANVIEYKKAIQLKAISYKLCDAAKVDVSNFIEVAPIDADKVYNEIIGVFNSFENAGYAHLMHLIMQEYGARFKVWPAAIRNHHEIKHGLMWHSYTMLQTAQALSKIYADREIDFELLYAGVILHDMGKVIEIDNGISNEFSIEGKLLGHISIMSGALDRIGHNNGIDQQTITLLQHMVLASHGKLEYGSPVEPHLLEAEILSFLDNMDARIYRVNKELQNVNIGDATPMLPALEKRWFIRHKK